MHGMMLIFAGESSPAQMVPSFSYFRQDLWWEGCDRQGVQDGLVLGDSAYLGTANSVTSACGAHGEPNPHFLGYGAYSYGWQFI